MNLYMCTEMLDRFNVVPQKALTHSNRYDDIVQAIIGIQWNLTIKVTHGTGQK